MVCWGGKLYAACRHKEDSRDVVRDRLPRSHLYIQEGRAVVAALSLLADMNEAVVAPNMTSFVMATSACKKGAQWEQEYPCLPT